VLYKLGRHDEALASYDRAIAWMPDRADFHFNRGFILGRLGRHVEALASFDRAIALKPDYVDAHHNRSLKLLLLGHYNDGFKAYEWRQRTPHKPLQFTQPQWHGESIADKTILLHAEQGFGDTLQMLRYLPLVKSRAARVILVLHGLHSAIDPLLEALADGITVLEPGASIPPFDVHCSLMSLPLAFRTEIDTVPAPIPYLTAPADRLAVWRHRLPASAAPRIGLAWAGSPTNANDRHRSIALERLAPLFDVAGVSWVSLQQKYRPGDLSALSRFPIERIDDALADFGDTAAAIGQCDLVISVDTSIAHLAGGLGKPVWVLLPHVPDWRWLLDRADSPWYPTARLFRQGRIGDWDGVIADVGKELTAYTNQQINEFNIHTLPSKPAPHHRRFS
jgi:tetratricopeptide (TPR) repeat protein